MYVTSNKVRKNTDIMEMQMERPRAMTTNVTRIKLTSFITIKSVIDAI